MKILWGALLVLFCFSWGIGAGSDSWGELAKFFSGQDVSATANTVLFSIRLPRLLAALLAGGMLAAAGCATQTVFRNDLASPHVLGAVNAAALGAVLGLLFHPGAMVLFAILFGIGSLLLISIPGRMGKWDGATLILSGIAVNACSSALTSGCLYLADERLSAMVFWLLGGFWRITWSDIWLLAPVAVGGWLILWHYRREMDLLHLGERSAALAGVPVGQVRFMVLGVVAVLAAVTVSCCGVIGFVGLAVPHIVRLLSGGAFHKLLPRSILTGGILLLAADLIARTAAAPHEIPVGILTALAGGPFFFGLLLRRRNPR